MLTDNLHTCLDGGCETNGAVEVGVGPEGAISRSEPGSAAGDDQGHGLPHHLWGQRSPVSRFLWKFWLVADSGGFDLDQISRIQELGDFEHGGRGLDIPEDL